MAYKTVVELKSDQTIKLGGKGADGKPNPTSIEGYYLGKRETKSDYGVGVIHFFQTQDGNIGVWGKTNMNRLLSSERVGQMVLVRFTGMGKPQKGKAAPYNYQVQYDEDNTIDVGGVELGAQDTEVHEDVESFDEEPMDEVPPPRAVAPKHPASTPSASSQAKVQALLNSRRNTA